MSHPTTMYVRPAQGLTLRDPVTGETLPEAGRTVPRSGFWLRRRDAGDVIEGPPPASGKAAAKALVNAIAQASAPAAAQASTDAAPQALVGAALQEPTETSQEPADAAAQADQARNTPAKARR